jgi:hypothetical protein
MGIHERLRKKENKSQKTIIFAMPNLKVLFLYHAATNADFSAQIFLFLVLF